MRVKLLEVRDEGTFIPALCVDMNPGDGVYVDPAQYEARRYLLRRSGYPCDGKPNIGFTHLDASGGPFWYDPHGWNASARTIPIAHDYIIGHWDELKDGDVVDVQVILGETEKPKVSERTTAPVD